MAKLEAVSLQKFSPIASEYTKLDITSDGELSIITKFSYIWHPNLASASATLFTSRNTCCTLQCWNLPRRDLQSISRWISDNFMLHFILNLRLLVLLIWIVYLSLLFNYVFLGNDKVRKKRRSHRLNPSKFYVWLALKSFSFFLFFLLHFCLE